MVCSVLAALGIDLSVGQNVRIDIQLQLGSVAETVEVSASAPLVDARSSASGEVVERTRSGFGGAWLPRSGKVKDHET
jgi:hypothetical protein